LNGVAAGRAVSLRKLGLGSFTKNIVVRREPCSDRLPFLQNGKWKDRAIVSEKWMQMARTPSLANEIYGFANWDLNTGRKPLPNAPTSAVWFEGNGNNLIYIDWGQ
jgi:hypothetical protein